MISSTEQLDAEDKEIQARVKSEQEHYTNVISLADTIPTIASIEKITKDYSPPRSEASPHF